jgi:hypothetical protein
MSRSLLRAALRVERLSMPLSPKAKAQAKLLIAKRYTEDEMIGSLLEDGSIEDDEITAARQFYRENSRRVTPINQSSGSNSRHGRSGPSSRSKKQVSSLDFDASAQYRFVRLGKKVIPAEAAALAPLAQMTGNLIDADLEVEWIFETEMLVGEAPIDPAKTGKPHDGNDSTTKGEPSIDQPIFIGDEWVIPGATLRGAVRAVMEILCYGRMNRVNQNARFGLRDFGHPSYVENSAIMKANEVKAGWLIKDSKGKPAILPASDWGYVSIFDLIDKKLVQSPSLANITESDIAVHSVSRKKIGTLDEVKARIPWARLTRADKYKAVIGKSQLSFDLGGTPIALGPEVKVSLKVGGGARPEYAPNGTLTGALVFSGRQPIKGVDAEAANSEMLRRVEYVLFPPAAGTLATAIEPHAWAQFEYANCAPRRGGREPDGAWKDLQREWRLGAPIPVFWVGELDTQDKKFAFGLTRLFKIPHAFSVGDMLERSSKQHLRPALTATRPPAIAADMIEALFGHVYEKDEIDFGAHEPVENAARRGRIQFSMGYAPLKAFEKTETITTVMLGPRASYAPYYLAGDCRDWSEKSETVTLAGRKRYLPRHSAQSKTRKSAASEALTAMIPMMAENNRNKKPEPGIQTKLSLLRPCDGSGAFTSRIRLRGVTQVELGALVFALTFGGQDSLRHMIGRAKGFGAGQCRAVISALKAERLDGAESWDATPEKCASLMAEFEKHMDWEYGGRAGGWRNSPPIVDLFAVADPKTAAAIAGGEAEAKMLRAKGLKPLELKQFGKARDEVRDGAVWGLTLGPSTK